MTNPNARLVPEDRNETNRREALVGNINHLLFKQAASVVLLRGMEKDGKQMSVKALGGTLKTTDVRPSLIGVVQFNYIDLQTGETTTESTTISIDDRQYKLEGDEAKRIDEHQEGQSEEDVLGAMFEIVTPYPNGLDVKWDINLSRLKALEPIEANWSLDWAENYS